jgi:hypothetical protein
MGASRDGAVLALRGSQWGAVLALRGSQWGFVLLEGVWAIVSVWGLAVGLRVDARRE